MKHHFLHKKLKRINKASVLTAIAIFFIFSPLPANQSASQSKNSFLPPVLGSTQLIERLNDHQLKILDIRVISKNQDQSNEENLYLKGSISAPYPLWRSKTPNNPGAVPPIADLEATIGNLGLNLQDAIVIIFAGKNSTDFGSAARVYWTLKYLGFKNLSILSGGFNALIKEKDNNKNFSNQWLTDQPTETDPSTFKAAIQSQWLVETEEVIFQSKKNKSEIVLLDSRNDNQYNGKTKHPKAPRFGAIDNSVQLWQEQWFKSGTAKLKNLKELKTIAAEHGITKNQTIYTYCNTGHWAATEWFVLSEVLRYDKVKLYPDSLVYYSSLDTKLKNTPSRLNLLWREFKGWF